MRTHPYLFVAVLLSAAALALAQQTPEQPETPQEPQGTTAEPRQPVEQRIERIRIEDKGSTVEELRVGGETQSITVQPKANVPPYEVEPADGARKSGTQREGSESGSQGGGTRKWNIKSF